LEEKKKGFSGIPWPWNLILSIVFVAGAGFFIGYLWSFLIAMGASAWMKSRNPGMPSGGYCLEKTRKQLSSLGIAVLILFFAFCAAVYTWMMLEEDRTAWETMEYAKFAGSIVMSAALFLLGIYTAYIAIRDTFWPQNSTLARSIRSQLPYPDAAPGAAELFAMVDKDIEENGQWFDKIAVGKEWILGEVAGCIPRIRVYFGRDEIRTRRSGDRVNSTRIVELHILDDRRQHHILSLRNPRELEPLLNCISLRAPDAICRPYSEFGRWQGKSDMEWENLLREFRVKQGSREMSAFQLGNRDADIQQNVTLTRPDGSVTSRVTPDLIHQSMTECLQEGEGSFSLALGCPIEQHNVRYVEMECFASFYEDMEDVENPTLEDMTELGEAELFLKMTDVGEAGKNHYFGRVFETDIQTAEEILKAWAKGVIPNMTGWEATPMWEKKEQAVKREVPPPHLALMSPSGVFQSHDRFTIEDVEVVAEGLVDGSCQMAELVLTGGYLLMRIDGGSKMDGRCTVTVTRPDGAKLRFFKNQCTHRQAAAWLLEFASGNFAPDWKEWKDCTRQAERDMAHKK
jgi:hypothetical protein